tara:strand:+ start:149 stop:538 length:390 start_codon:yes stop_codon:yes gene_type:complete
MPKDTTPIGLLIDAYYRLRDERNELNKQVKEINGKLYELGEVIIARLDEDCVDSSRGAEATASIKETVVAHIEDFDQFEKFVIRHKKLHLLEKRVSSAAFRAELEERGEVPGLKPFTKRTISVQKRSKQ